ncbi:hypothetical protein [Trichococcus collinsii]|uniref:Uncharacterized protein n=1 Tax=Trichococcus collinsii TaxID=157076 RepID=A0AB37ZXE1_9LACT|nr:hypothetical protein [Trichococcus collinsii]CZR02446.1 Hypothetical protein Tcol_2045 [Trichococcus collinsii]SDZ95268.1 hypothetical protein SAMN04488525_101709 [Trichococcus collinsii]
MNDPDIFKNPCGVCGKKSATRLCDFIIDYHSTIFYRDFQDFKNQGRLETCDLPMCDGCATEHVGHDFCPQHEKLFHQLKLTDEKQIKAQFRQKARYLFESKEG